VKLRELSSAMEFDVELERDGSAIEARVDSAALKLANQPLPDGAMLVECGGERVRAFAARMGDSIVVSIGPRCFTFKLQEAARGGARRSLATPLLTAPMPGKVLKIMVREGDEVMAGQPMITMEAMKMETTLNAEGPARVKAIPVSPGQMVDAGAVLIELSPLDSAKPQSDR
jgi:3-methylcrotonyl-CoA carboxylase alpha subunit